MSPIPPQGVEQALGSCQHLGTSLPPLTSSFSRSLTIHAGEQEALPYREAVL